MNGVAFINRDSGEELETYPQGSHVKDILVLLVRLSTVYQMRPMAIYLPRYQYLNNCTRVILEYTRMNILNIPVL
jgi:hypothetical protein